MDALVKLLIEKYGVPPDQAEDYAADIVASSNGTSDRKVNTGSRGVYLQEEALAGVADDTLANYADLTNFAETASAGGRSDLPSLKKAYDARLAESAHMTRQAAAQSTADRKKIGDDHTRGQGLADNELKRLAAMLDYSKANIAYRDRGQKLVDREVSRMADMGNVVYTEDGLIGYKETPNPPQPVNVTVGEPRPEIPHEPAINQIAARRAMGVGKLYAVEPPDPYVERLKRATQARQAMLGN